MFQVASTSLDPQGLMGQSLHRSDAQKCGGKPNFHKQIDLMGSDDAEASPETLNAQNSGRANPDSQYVYSQLDASCTACTA